ncbi:glycosyltransferase family 4 protein [Halosimplex litoreum]|uniref:Glycosyltransferase family 4 protein n=1 Tax=Halosimplex litoreum TaxID=1198301 RepID=A0A7T3FYT7_9EURY|nr:glycosyltransferase family 4 protein [Halosimplex litoreum]QPV63205.1 glycosyltransferase family 4 protein [Halosimplex litoreum]
MTLRVLFVAFGDEQTASTRYRILNYLPYLSFETRVDLRKDRHFTEFSKVDKPAYTTYLLLSALVYDIIYIQKLLLPSRFVTILNRFCKVIYDFDDAIYTSAPWEQTDTSNRTRMLNEMLKAASTVITGSPILTEYARDYTDNIHTLPTSVPRDEYTKARLEEHRTDDTVILGWIGNPENLWYLEQRENVISELLETYPEVELHVVTAGNEQVPFEKRVGKDVFYQEWSLDEELALVSEFDIAIRPLTDDEWTRGKGGYTSVVQCLAMGVPVVASPVGMLSSIVEDGSNGYCPADDSEWFDCLSDLIENRKRRERFAESAVESIEENHFWTDQRAEELRSILSSPQ